MARYEFKVLVSDIDLSDEQEQEIGRAVAQAGAAAVADATSKQPMSLMIDNRIFWCGFIRDPDLLRAIEVDVGITVDNPLGGPFKGGELGPDPRLSA